MRYTRAGKSTHQRVPQESTSWDELKATPQKSKDAAKNGNFKGQRGGKGNASRDKFKGKNNGGRNRREVEESANFVELGDRTKPNEPGKKNVMGFGKTKQVKIFGHYWVGSDEARRLQSMSKKLKSQGMSKKEIVEGLKNERRRAEKTARRARDKTCFNCRQFGHVLFDCPKAKANNGEGGEGNASTGETDTTNQIGSEICFKCGSTEHTSRFCKKRADKFDFAKCFICSKTGHIARQCPENTKGIYPAGGCCNICEETTHLAIDCPSQYPAENENRAHVNTDGDDAVAGRMSNPYASLEYEDVGVEVTKAVKVIKKKHFEEPEIVQSQTNEPRAKKRKVKF